MKNVNARRKEEGVSLASISNKKMDYRAEMLTKSLNGKDNKGNKPNLAIGKYSPQKPKSRQSTKKSTKRRNSKKDMDTRQNPGKPKSG